MEAGVRYFGGAATPLHFGGQRQWLVCASCGVRVGKLYLPPSERAWACRRCHDLIYASQRKNRMLRGVRSVQKIREILGGSLNLFTPFPERPKGMHFRTYWNLREEAERRGSLLAAAVSLEGIELRRKVAHSVKQAAVGARYE